ncbi:hypothetical protein FGG08_004512 [Glutinoglossum americanum]|uniref:Uncharacterized protein n=1 Tax=Glutinoglossum americanum TaxID=1670608 RepID=A0A9P8L2F2_9PEZI|nr:hypothetical protein FGG08_004512 [Glutinoglossum americanum]
MGLLSADPGPKHGELQQSFANGAMAPSEILNTFFRANPKITEHGPEWASSRLPFIGKTFSGRSSTISESATTCDDYFRFLSATVAVHPSDNTFPPASGFMVSPGTASLSSSDGGSGIVSVKGHIKISSVATGNSWEEDFIFYFSEFDREGRFGHFKIWGDPLSCWLAVVGI